MTCLGGILNISVQKYFVYRIIGILKIAKKHIQPLVIVSKDGYYIRAERDNEKRLIKATNKEKNLRSGLNFI